MRLLACSRHAGCCVPVSMMLHFLFQEQNLLVEHMIRLNACSLASYTVQAPLSLSSCQGAPIQGNPLVSGVLAAAR